MSVEEAGGPRLGGILGINNVPTLITASGVWQATGDHYEARLADVFPYVARAYFGNASASTAGAPIRGIAFSTETDATVTPTVNFWGGFSDIAFAYGMRYQTADLIGFSFPSETLAIVGSGPVYVASGYLEGRGEFIGYRSATNGYIYGGIVNNSAGTFPARPNSAAKIPLSTLTASTITPTGNSSNGSGYTTSTTAYLVRGGSVAGATNTIWTQNLSTDAYSTSAATLNGTTINAIGWQDATTAHVPYRRFASPVEQRLDILTFATETIASGNPHPVSSLSIAGAAQSPTIGFHRSGYKYEIATGTWTDLSIATLSSGGFNPV